MDVPIPRQYGHRYSIFVPEEKQFLVLWQENVDTGGYHIEIVLLKTIKSISRISLDSVIAGKAVISSDV